MHARQRREPRAAVTGEVTITGRRPHGRSRPRPRPPPVSPTAAVLDPLRDGNGKIIGQFDTVIYAACDASSAARQAAAVIFRDPQDETKYDVYEDNVFVQSAMTSRPREHGNAWQGEFAALLLAVQKSVEALAKKAAAAEQSSSSSSARPPRPRAMIVVGVDSVNVMVGVAQRYAKSEASQFLIDAIHNCVSKNGGHRLLLTYVPSKMQVCDELSKNKQVTPSRARGTLLKLRKAARTFSLVQDSDIELLVRAIVDEERLRIEKHNAKDGDDDDDNIVDERPSLHSGVRIADVEQRICDDLSPQLRRHSSEPMRALLKAALAHGAVVPVDKTHVGLPRRKLRKLLGLRRKEPLRLEKKVRFHSL